MPGIPTVQPQGITPDTQSSDSSYPPRHSTPTPPTHPILPDTLFVSPLLTP